VAFWELDRCRPVVQMLVVAGWFQVPPFKNTDAGNLPVCRWPFQPRSLGHWPCADRKSVAMMSTSAWSRPQRTHLQSQIRLHHELQTVALLVVVPPQPVGRNHPVGEHKTAPRRRRHVVVPSDFQPGVAVIGAKSSQTRARTPSWLVTTNLETYGCWSWKRCRWCPPHRLAQLCARDERRSRRPVRPIVDVRCRVPTQAIDLHHTLLTIQLSLVVPLTVNVALLTR